MDERMRKLKLAQGAQWMKDQAESGLSKRAWCREHDVPRASFFYYQRVLRQKVLDENPVVEEKAEDVIAGAVMPPALVEVPVCAADAVESPAAAELPAEATAPSEPARDDRVEISCGSFSISIPDDINEKSLTRILKAVKHAD